MGDFNVNYKNKSSPAYKKLHFFTQSNGLTQYINTATRNTDKTKSLIDLAITNSKSISKSGSLDHYISDHQPIFIVHKKGRDNRQSVKFEGRSYRHFDRAAFTKALLEADWGIFYGIENPEQAWEFILNSISTILDNMCPLRTFHIKNYRPDWITNELIEQIKDRDYFYKKAKSTTNANIRMAKRDFILDELEANADNCRKFWKVIRGVIPSDKQKGRHDILMKDKGRKLEKKEVASFINDYFINVGKVVTTESTEGKDDDEGRTERAFYTSALSAPECSP